MIDLRSAAAAPVIAVAMMAQCAAAGQQQPHAFDLPAQPLSVTLQAIAKTTGVNVIAPAESVAGKTAPVLSGQLTFDRALEIALAGSGLRAQRVGDAVVIRSAEAASSADPSTPSVAGSDVVVTGSRIRGAPAASPVITLGRDEIRREGQPTLADALRRIPQAFGGGQNPGIGNDVPESNGADLGGASSVNLRGVGSDATLTLIDGRRLGYSGFDQSVDISGIPLGALDRVEIVPDGASALFGSDAVAGVVNVVLRRNFAGAEASARVAGSTEGGDFQQQYDVTVGQRWASGSVLAAYEYGSNTAIDASERDYAATRAPGVTLYPALRRHSVAGTFRQELATGVTFDVDALFNKRWTDRGYPLNFAGDLTQSRQDNGSVQQSWTLAPALIIDLPAAWRATLLGSYSFDRADYFGTSFAGAAPTSSASGDYRNHERNVELSGDGPLFALPGGTAKLALGAGYRSIGFQRDSSQGATQHIDHTQTSNYAFAELSLPVIKGLEASGAVRYERYPGVGEIATPKLGLVWAATPDLSLKGSWGRSFRAPTQYERFQPQEAYLLRATSVGATGAPANATALLLIGGSATLKPERSTNWSATLDVHPRAVPGLSVEASYFSIDYGDRIVTPIPTFSRALRDAIYANRITTNPSSAAQTAATTGASSFTNISGATYDPTAVLAIVDDRSVNASEQRFHGVDLLGRYRLATGSSTWSLALDGSYLTSHQQIGVGYPVTQLAGAIYNPSHFRGRGDLSWEHGPAILSAGLTYIGPVVDNRTAASVQVPGMAPLDLTARYVLSAGHGALSGLGLTLSAFNVLDEAPAPIATSVFYDTPYDSTTYTPFGRVLSLTVSKSW